MKIVFVDEDEGQRITYSLLLQKCFPNEAGVPQVIGIAPAPQLSDMKFLIEDSEIVTIVLDEQLKESGVAQYLGIELAVYLRSLNSKIPIYILTSWPDSDDLLHDEMSIEDILNKNDLSERKHIVGARILRQVDSYVKVSSERERKFENLLKRSLAGEINEEEKEEFIELGYLRSAPFQADEIMTAESLTKLEALDAQISEIKNRLSENL